MTGWVRPPMAEATARRKARMAKAQKGMCSACQSPLPEDLTETEIDHIIPLARGGPNDAWNKRLVHLRCNRVKSMKLTPEAVALAAEHGVRIHLPQPTWAHATRPLIRAKGLEADRRDRQRAALSALGTASSPEEHDRLWQGYLDICQETWPA